MTRKWIAAAAVAAALAAAPAAAQMGYGPGMMGGNGPGYGMGPGMMGGYGQGYGMGPGMMGGYGMGPGMMGGADSFAGLKLDDTQRAKLAAIRKDLRGKHWAMMQAMQEQRDKLDDLQASGKADDAAERAAYDAMSELHKKMFEASLDARKRMDEVLTQEQREQLRRGWGRGGAG